MYIETAQMCTTISQCIVFYFSKNGDTQTFWSQPLVSSIAATMASQTLQDTSSESNSDTDSKADSSEYNQPSEGKLALFFNNYFVIIFVFLKS